MTALKNVDNPMLALQSLASKNPQVKQTLDLVNQSGGNAKEAFYKRAQELGVNPNDILNTLK